MTRAAVIGAGVIGRSWAALMVARGWEARVQDPSAEALAAVAAYVEQTVPQLARTGPVVDGWAGRLTTVDSVEEAVDGADLVQESAPERTDLKAELLARVDAAAPAHAPVASSSSTFRPSELAAMCTAHPERVLVGHPFHPVHLVPLVEVVGTPATSPAVVDRAMGLYRDLGRRPVHVRREVPGHLVNRLQAALWREAYSLVEQGVATVADVDAAISHGPGLRWALLGPLLGQHLSGGDGGIAWILEHLGPPTQAIMDDLGDVRLSPELAETLVAGVDAEIAGRDLAAVVAERDRLLVDLLAAKQGAPLLDAPASDPDPEDPS